MATVYTSNGTYEVSASDKQVIEKTRASVLGLMRKAFQLQSAYQGTLYLCGPDAPVTVSKRGAYERSSARLDERTAQLRTMLERIEQECPKVTTKWDRLIAGAAA